MKKNVGKIDRFARVIIGGIIALWALGQGSWLWVLGVLILLTGFIGWCGVYKAFGISTCKTQGVVKPITTTNMPKQEKPFMMTPQSTVTESKDSSNPAEDMSINSDSRTM